MDKHEYQNAVRDDDPNDDEPWRDEMRQLDDRRLSSTGRLPSDIDGDKETPAIGHQSDALHILETTYARLEEVEKMPPILQKAAYLAIRIDMRDSIAECQYKFSQQAVQLAQALRVLRIAKDTIPSINGNERSVHSLLKEIKTVIPE